MDKVSTQARREERRDARRASNRAEMLDAAERVFGAQGIREGSLRQIAELSGFSTAAIYLFFHNKQHLLAETLIRRGDELVAVLRAVARQEGSALDRLHLVIDATAVFFAGRPHFRELMRHVRGDAALTGPVLEAFANDVSSRFQQAMDVLASLVREGQEQKSIREGDPRALAHFYSVLINEYVLLQGDQALGALTADQFHAMVDGALRSPNRRPGRTR
jgi:AcrR family transcriptional regulator